jgi:hypothetical protein
MTVSVRSATPRETSPTVAERHIPAVVRRPRSVRRDGRGRIWLFRTTVAIIAPVETTAGPGQNASFVLGSVSISSTPGTSGD